MDVDIMDPISIIIIFGLIIWGVIGVMVGRRTLRRMEDRGRDT